MTRLMTRTFGASLALVFATSLVLAQGTTTAKPTTTTPPTGPTTSKTTQPAPTPSTVTTSKPSTMARHEPLDINSATEAQLMELPGIGKALAAKIVAGRPYANKTQLTSKKVLTDSVYKAISGEIIAKQPVKK